MAKVRVTVELIAEMLFGYTEAPVTVEGCDFDSLSQTCEFEISGINVPAVENVTADVTVEQNRAGQKLYRMTFRPAP